MGLSTNGVPRKMVVSPLIMVIIGWFLGTTFYGQSHKNINVIYYFYTVTILYSNRYDMQRSAF